MRRSILVLLAAMVCVAAQAQIAFKFDKKSMLDAIARSDEDVAHPKRSLRGQTWLDRGDALFAAAGFMLSHTYPGQSKAEMLLRLGKAEGVEKKVNNRTFIVMSYPYADVYLAKDVVQFWVMKVEVYPGAEQKAVDAYNKAAELDPKLKDKATKGIQNVGDVASVKANSEFNLGNFDAAADAFWTAFKIKNEPLVGKVDSTSVFNAGYINMMNRKFDKAIEILETAAKNNVWEGGKTAYYLSFAYLQTQRYPEAKALLDKGLELFPGDKDLTTNMINYYSLTGSDFNEIRSTLEKAIVATPGNQAVWSGLGRIVRDEKDNEKTIEYFTKYVAKFPEEMEPNFYLGDALYEKGNQILMAADGNKTMSKASVEQAVGQAKEAYRQAWEYLIKAYDYSVQRDQKLATVQRLRYVAHRLIDEPGMEDNFNKFDAEYTAMGEK